nr:unnamed protein product [Callosobruchus analis]
MRDEIDIIFLTETWLTESVYSSELFVSTFSIYRKDRVTATTGLSKGGGVLIAIKNEYNFEAIDLSMITLSTPKIDLIGGKIIFESSMIYVFVVYIPPDTSADDLELFLDQFIVFNLSHSCSFVLVGDFNVPAFSLDQNDKKHRLLNDFAELCSIKQYNDILNQNGRLLDLIFSSVNCSSKRDDMPLVIEDRHHPAIFFSISLQNTSSRASQFSSKRCSNVFNFRKANFPLMYHLVATSSWDSVLQATDPNTACDELAKILHDIFELSVPFKLPPRRRFPPWFSANTIKNIIQKEFARKNYKKYNTTFYRHRFNELRKQIKRQIDSDYRNFISDASNNILRDPSAFWSFIRNKKRDSRIPGIMKWNDNIYPEPQEIVNGFAKYFASVYTVPDKSLLENLNLNYGQLPIISLTEITEADIVKASKKIKNKLIVGPDQVPSFLVKDCISALIQPLVHIFNIILKTCVIPTSWKLSRVSPILKKGDPALINNYRSVCVLSNFAKLFEIICHETIYNATKNIIADEQHGFMQKKSCTTNLACISQYISSCLDNRGQTDVIYLDIQKAFDQVDLGILLMKLDHLGFSPSLLSLFRSYLFERKQFVEYEGFRSKLYTPTSGVPQGSNLGPLLFILYINDLATSLTCPKLIYADDLKLYHTISTENDCRELQLSLVSVERWCDKNHLSLNAKKCVIVTYSRKKHVLDWSYEIGSELLDRKNVIKDLGIMFDSELSFQLHISETVSSANRMLGFIIRNGKDFQDLTVLKTLYVSYVQSKLEYCSIIWYPIYSIYINAIERVQRKYLKLLSFKSSGVYPDRGCDYSLLLDEHQYNSLNTRRILGSLYFLHSLLNNEINCPYLLSQICYHVPRISSRHSKLFYCDLSHTNTLRRSPVILMCSNFELVDRQCDIHNTSRSAIKQCLLRLTYNI